MTSSKPSQRPIDVTLTADMSGLNKALRHGGGAVARLREALRKSPKVRHLPRRSGVGARQVLRPHLGKASRHPWAHERDSNGRIIPLVEGGGPLEVREA